MSLLLDALKKAAKEKHKNTQANHNRGENESLELELNPSVQQKAESDNFIQDESPQDDFIQDDFSQYDFPHVSDPEIKLAVTIEKIYPDNKAADVLEDPGNSLEVEDIDAGAASEKHVENIPGEQPENLELQKIDFEQTDKAENNSAKNTPQEVSSISSVSSATAQREEVLETLAETKIKSKVENEKVLSELIIRSNQYSRKRQIKKNISIVVLVLLVVTGAILYFYIEMQTVKQDIYIADGEVSYNKQNEVDKLITEIEDKEDVEINQAVETNRDNFKAPDLDGYIADKKLTKKYSKKNNGLSVRHEPIKNRPIKSRPIKSRPVKNRPVKNRPVKNRPVKNRPVKHKPVNNTSVKFSRTKKRDPVHKIVLRAYSEFKNKNYKQSENLYNNALNMDKKNRDALLGLAAIAVKQQRYEFARKKYNRILRLNPGDSIATAGLIGIDKQADSQLSESRIKFMLRDEPDAAPLHFALGNIYSKEKKWPDAQKSYFNAWSVDDKNSDYAFNLAVSLDHLNKKKQALKFYLTSLKLKHENGGNFSTAGVETRINSLKKSLR